MHAIALLPALLLANPTIDGASATIVDGRLEVEVTVSEPMIREDVRAKIDGEALAIYVDGATAAKKSFGAGPLAVTVLPRAKYAKLQIPLAAELGCSGPIALQLTGDDTKVRASMRCTGEAAAAPAEASAPAVAAPVVAAKPAAKPQAKPAAEWKAPPAAEKAAPAKAPPAAEKAAPAAEKAPPPAETAVAAVEKVTAAAEKVPVPTEKIPLGKPSNDPFATKSEATAARAEAKEALAGNAKAPNPSPLTLTIFVALAGVAAYLLWRKRKKHQSGLIKILETASIGPKRSIVIAEVNGERMILGTSEAGISVLSSASGGHFTSSGISPALAQAAAAASPKAATSAPAAGSSAVPVIAGEGESNILKRLFQRHKNDDAAGDDDGPSTMAEDFRDLLEDSLEDEELRRRLASGSGGRTA